MRIPARDGVLSSSWLTDALESSPEWPHGPVRVVSATRIGTTHGFSGRIHRVLVEAARGTSLTLVVKQERVDSVERELLFRAEVGEAGRGALAHCYGGWSEAGSGRGVLVLEDIARSEQGDVLEGCSEERAREVVRTLARLHAASWRPEQAGHAPHLPRWSARPLEASVWAGRLARARERFPQVLTSERSARISGLSSEVEAGLERLRDGPSGWLQVDCHLDNVLWRPDGSAVLLDWCNAAVGPPEADLARFLSEGVDASSRPALTAAYAGELEANGAPSSGSSDLGDRLRLALPHLLQSAVGWAGREDLAPAGRPAAVCESWLRSVCRWALAFEG